MTEKLNVHYDKEGDLLEISVGKPTKGYFRNLGDDVFEKVDEKTGKVKGFAIIGFKKRIEKAEGMEVKTSAADSS